MDQPRVVLFGATGFTGRLTAEAMTRAGLAPVLAGRNEQALTELTRKLSRLVPSAQAPTWQCADVNEPDTVRDLVSNTTDVLVSTVGPFTRFGAVAVDAAVTAGCTYIDSTGESGFIYQLFERSAEFKQGGAKIVPACGYDFIPGNLAGAIALRNCRDRDEWPSRVKIGYFTQGPMNMSSGTKASALASLGSSGYTFQSGQLVDTPLGTKFAEFTLADGKKYGAINIGGTEQFALPRMNPRLLNVDVYLGWAGKWSKPASSLAALTSPITKSRMSRHLLNRLTSSIPTTTGQGPSGPELTAGRSVAIATVHDAVGNHLETVQVSGPAPYPFTAEFLAWAAAMAHAGRINGTGTLDPISAFGLGPFIAGCSAIGLRQVRNN